VPDETSYDEPPPYDCIPESADGEPDHEPAKVAIPITEESDSLEEWDAGDDTGLPPPREWLLGNQFCRKFLSGLLAPGATGKSALRLLQLMSLATGRPLSGQHVFKRSRVLLVSLEDDRDELRRRIAAACIHHGVERAELQGWLYCWTPKGIKLAEIKDNARQKGRLETLIRDKVKVRKIDLVALDPFIKRHAVEENDNGAMDYVCDLLTKIAIDGNIAVDAPHHTKKGQQTAGDADAGRGASSARDAGRLLYTLTRMSEEEAKAFGIPAEQRALRRRLRRPGSSL
jgi:RecA-family ATPase